MKPNLVSHTSKVMQKIALGIIALAIFFILYIGYLLFSPIEVLEVSVPLPASPVQVAAGGTVNIHFDYCKYEQYESHIKIDFIGKYIIPTLSTTRNFPLGCHAETLAISIPSGTPAGIYTIRLAVDYKVNPIRNVHYTFESVEIEVLNDNEKPTVDIGSSEE